MTPPFRILMGALFLAALFALAWRVVNAQTTICRSVAIGVVTCQTLPAPPPPPSYSLPVQPFDPSVIRDVPDGVTIDPMTLRLMLLQKCIQREIQKGYIYSVARQRCLQ